MADPSPSPRERLLAVDFGDRRTGLAATDFTGTIAVPLPALVGLSDAACAAAIAELAEQRDTARIVVGLPLDASDRIGARAERTLAFVRLLAHATSRPVETCDERYTTDEAHEMLRDAGLRAARRKRLADSVAALVILERFRSGG